MLSSLSAHKSNRVDVEQQRGRAPLPSRFGIKKMGFPERQLKGMHSVRVLVEQVAQIRCRIVRGCDGQQHESGLYGGRIWRLTMAHAPRVAGKVAEAITCLDSTRRAG
jgi:hypothetical protein